VINVESNYQPAARSAAGAVGLMQLMPDTANRYNVKNRLDPKQISWAARAICATCSIFSKTT